MHGSDPKVKLVVASAMVCLLVIGVWRPTIASDPGKGTRILVELPFVET